MIITRRLCSTVAVFLSIGVVLSASAQVRRQGPDLTQSLTEKDRPIVQRLGNYASIEANAWRFHAGDVPHGESPQLDDHDWAAATPATPLGEDAVWLRQWIEIPKDIGGYDFSGAQVMFALHASSNSNVPQIIYLNGNRVALGEDLEPITLVASAHPGDRVLVAVKLLATSSPKHLRRTEIHVVPATGRPDPSILQAEILTAASLIPSLSKNPASDMAIVERAIGQIEEGEQNPANFDRSLESAETTLAVLRPLLRQVTYHLTGNSHIDAAWLWPVSETVDVVHRTFATALQLMDEYPQYTYTQSAAQYNEWLADKYPSINRKLRSGFVKDGGRLSAACGSSRT
jgi:alpha-mannosidase